MNHKFCCRNSVTRCEGFHQRVQFRRDRIRIRYTGCSGNRFRLLAQAKGDNWKLPDVDASAINDIMKNWLSRTQRILSDVATPLIKSRDGNSNKNLVEYPLIDLMIIGHTSDLTTPYGKLSLAAVVSIEQFSRMNGSTGYKMQKNYQSQFPDTGINFGRNLVEYCCFRYLSKDTYSALYHCLTEPEFQQLIFIAMLAWENPYASINATDGTTFVGKLVSEEAFIRIAPKISGVADNSTVSNLFKALCREEQGLSLNSWMTYISELLKVHEGRASYEIPSSILLEEEKILCVGSNRKQPVLKWEDNFAWPGKVILSDKALYFEGIGIGKKKDMIRIDLSRSESQVRKTKVGPLGSSLFDSALSVSYGPSSETWVLEFVDLGGEARRDVWFAFISEVISLHKFIREYGPKHEDLSISNVYGANRGYEKAINSAINGIARLQVLHFIRKVADDPIRLVQFAYLQNAPYGDIVQQTLALNFWGGPLIKKSNFSEYEPTAGVKPNHVFDIDGSIYLKKWMRSSSWSSDSSINFWKKTYIKQGLVLSKNLVVGDVTLVEKAASTLRDKSKLVEKTQATIDAAMVQGIPSNIDLFKELMLPLTITAMNFEKLRRWESPFHTISFLALVYSIIFRNFLPYLLPTILIIVAASILTLKGFKQQGRLGRLFGAVMIYDQPPSNTIQKIIAVKDALRDLENYLQKLNIILLKIRTILLGGHPEIATEVALVLTLSAIILFIFPFKYVLAFVFCDFFTRELNARKETVKKFTDFLKDRWNEIPAAPVIVLPFNGTESESEKPRTDISRATPPETGVASQRL